MPPIIVGQEGPPLEILGDNATAEKAPSTASAEGPDLQSAAAETKTPAKVPDPGVPAAFLPVAVDLMSSTNSGPAIGGDSGPSLPTLTQLPSDAVQRAAVADSGSACTDVGWPELARVYRSVNNCQPRSPSGTMALRDGIKRIKRHRSGERLARGRAAVRTVSRVTNPADAGKVAAASFLRTSAASACNDLSEYRSASCSSNSRGHQSPGRRSPAADAGLHTATVPCSGAAATRHHNRSHRTVR